MLNLKVNSSLGKFNVNLPTKFEEITNDYLEYATSHINVAPEYSLIGLVYREKLATILNSSKKNKEINTSVVPVFIKAGNTESKFINDLKLGNVIIVPGSDLAIGIHCNSPLNSLSIPNVVRVCSDDNSVYKYAITNTEYCYFLEFKFVPNSAIKGLIGKSAPLEVDPYISAIKED